LRGRCAIVCSNLLWLCMDQGLLCVCFFCSYCRFCLILLTIWLTGGGFCVSVGLIQAHLLYGLLCLYSCAAALQLLCAFSEQLLVEGCCATCAVWHHLPRLIARLQTGECAWTHFDKPQHKQT
jgi:hypothetical protein